MMGGGFKAPSRFTFESKYLQNWQGLQQTVHDISLASLQETYLDLVLKSVSGSETERRRWC